MILIILVQRPQGGGLAGAFGGAGGGSTDTVFGGRVGDALTAMTIVAFLGYLLLAIGLNIMEPSPTPQPTTVTPAAAIQPGDPVNNLPGSSAPIIEEVAPPAINLPPLEQPTTPPADDAPPADPGGDRF